MDGAPIGIVETGVEVFAKVDALRANRPFGGLPGWVGGDGGDLAGGIGEFEERGCEGLRAELRAGHQRAAEPAVGENEAEDVFARLDAVGDVVGHVVSAIAVVRPAGREEVVADLVAIEPRFDETERGKVEAGFRGFFGDVEFAAKITGRGSGVEGCRNAIADPSGGARPAGVEEPGFELGGSAPAEIGFGG